MTSEILATLERLAAANINLVPSDLNGYFVFERDGFVCLVEKTKHGAFGGIGSVCRLIEEGGFATVLWNGERAYYVQKGGHRIEASPEEITLFRGFSADLRAALRPGV